jgi:hypothetical protein
MAWHTATPTRPLSDLDDKDVLAVGLELYQALRDMQTRDPFLREQLHLDSLGDLEYVDTGEAMEARTSINRRVKYPWDLWANGDLWLLHRGADYAPVLSQFQTNVHMHGYNNDKVGVTRKLSEDVIAVQFTTAPVQLESVTDAS